MMDSVFRPCWYSTAACYIHSDIKKLSESEFFARKRAISRDKRLGLHSDLALTKVNEHFL